MVHVVVVGGGVNGVGSALALLQKAPKCHVTIVSDEFSPYTTGDGAGGLWGPYLLQGTPEEKILSWGQETWNLFRDWWKSEKNYGVSLVSGTVICQENEPTQPWYQIPLAYTTLTQDQLVKYGPEYKSGYRYTSFIAEASRFLPKLMVEVQERGGKFENQHVKSLHEVASQADLVLNCSGLGAKAVVPDDGVYPTRGQVMRVKAPWINHFFADDSDESFCFAIPNIDTVVLGGTHQDNDWRLEPDPVDTQAIWQKTTRLIPSLKQCEIVREWVGLRPSRKNGVRLEADEIKVNGRTVPVVHNYGHGGSGITTFWGCSQEVADIALQVIHKHYEPISKL